MDGKTDRRMVFVILHYNNREDTEKCIASLRQMPEWQDCAAVIVDNASPNGSGKQLAEQYAGEENITVLMNTANEGFSRGNNLGYRYAREHYRTGLITVCNNDIVFADPAFVGQVEEEYRRGAFDVLGPDIWNPRMRIHQSPLGEDSPNQAQVTRTIRLNRLADRFFPLFWALIGRKDAGRLTERKENAAGYDLARDNIPLMGACLVFAERFIREKEKVFEPETFLYYEEYLLHNECRRRGFRTVYRPGIRVEHMEGGSTVTLSRTVKDRYRRMVRNTLAAAEIYLKDLNRNS